MTALLPFNPRTADAPTDASALGVDRSDRPSAEEVRFRRLLVTTAFAESALVGNFGARAYSYRIVYQAFASLLERWARTEEIAAHRKVVDRRADELIRQGQLPIHLSFLPPQLMPMSRRTVNVGVPAWEFPNIPDYDLGGNPRENWVRQCRRMQTIVTHTRFSRDALVRADLGVPVHLVPVPVQNWLFRVPAWDSTERVVIDCPCYVFSDTKAPRPVATTNVAHGLAPRRRLTSLAKGVYHGLVRPMLPHSTARYLSRVKNAAARRTFRCGPTHSHLELSGVVYTSIFNGEDPRKNWRDLITGYLFALRDCADATLVVKLITKPSSKDDTIDDLIGWYARLGIAHRCKLAFVLDYLSDAQMLELARGTTYYVNTSHSEGSCLPLQDFLAAGRPSICPAHTGMADSVQRENSFLVDSYPEPAPWPQDPEHRLNTTWHRLVWQSLHDRYQESYRVAKSDLRRFADMAVAGREHMKDLASPERVWPLLCQALDDAQSVARRQPPSARAA